MAGLPASAAVQGGAAWSSVITNAKPGVRGAWKKVTGPPSCDRQKQGRMPALLNMARWPSIPGRELADLLHVHLDPETGAGGNLEFAAHWRQRLAKD